MSADLIHLWAQRDAAQEEWRLFMEEADSHIAGSDPVVIAMDTPRLWRTPEQEELIRVYDERQTALLSALHEAERKIRVATGHEKP